VLVNVACIDYYNDVKTHQSEHLQNILVTNGDFFNFKEPETKPLAYSIASVAGDGICCNVLA
jgi:hypothetical protein